MVRFINIDAKEKVYLERLVLINLIVDGRFRGDREKVICGGSGLDHCVVQACRIKHRPTPQSVV